MTLDGKRTEEAGGPPEYVKTLPHILRKRQIKKRPQHNEIRFQVGAEGAEFEERVRRK
jgi:hypothetical protein